MLKQSKSVNTANGRKLTFKPFKKPVKGLPDGFEEATWAKLQAAVRAVHNKEPVSTSLEELYKAVEDMCHHKMAESLYARLQKECDAHIASQIQRLASSSTADPVLFLDQVGAVWDDMCRQMLTIRQVFTFLDRSFVVAAPGVRSLFDMGLQQFRTHLEARPQVGEKLQRGLLQQIQTERRGDAINRQLLTNLLRMLSSLGIYSTAFEAPFLEETTQFFQEEGRRLMEELDPAGYLLHCERRLREELMRRRECLAEGTEPPLQEAVEAQLVAAHLAALLDRGFPTLVAARRLDDLARLYNLADRVDMLDPVRFAFRDHIKATGTALVMDKDKDGEMVQGLLDMKAAMDAVLQQSFEGDPDFGNTLKEAFEAFINQRQNKPAELIAKFIDAELKSGKKGQTEDQLEATLDRVLILFRYISGKDVFEAFYKKDLAKRLLLGRSASTDAEKGMIAKLKAQCGAQFTSKLEGMFKDVDLSRDIVSSFRSSTAAQARIPQGVDMNINIMTAGYWPTYPVVDAKLPAELNEYQQVFKDFYLDKHQGRRLVWHNSLGTCLLKAHFQKGPKELSVSLFQTVVLSLFNDADRLGFTDIAAATGIEDRELRRTLQSLACGKWRVLTKEPKGRDVNDGDTFVFNAGFSAQLYRIKINSIQMRETVEENTKTNEQVVQDRQHQIDAAIVRIMKTRKTLSHALLVSELLVQLKFPIRTQDMKKRIESLIDREFLARDSANSNVYQYLA
mmetsp:Transcript_6002/g.17169  ORF Transcript_6002/g.17169 Transcript_6002/m.17169 type:complete len:735 (-) Transcript_6002:2064-4268(-)|eukprot:CAMPEP_0206141362 /NCGR_PEP_ID=MMETSP1473-20131121/12666_1 /ASSEMBLY_ACC=CAM_ASM_001109 /TAXON_ID=1461547 /ORGANISM="Stichococcus sp, Strain RCC1054" /LENGTH=734 /DNA_ID=CAMNT_0053535899 /DNA_START=206 /DNA_END=2410 /DNA_ORIENTATION=-